MTNEEHCALKAVEVIKEAGGTITYEEYDKAIKKKIYFAPLHWAAGWGNPVTHRANTDKMCVFEAVRRGFVKIIPGGYSIEVFSSSPQSTSPESEEA